MLQLRSQKKTLSLAFVIDTVTYELQPYCQAHGADLWIEDVDEDRVVLGFRCGPGRRLEMTRWLEDAVARLAGGQPDRVRVLNLTTFAGSRRDG